MKAVALVLCLLFALTTAASFYPTRNTLDRIDGKYIVVLKNNLTATAVSSFGARIGAIPEMVWNMEGFQGGRFELNQDQLATLLQDEAVDFVEEDQMMRVGQQCVTQNARGIWNLARVSDGPAIVPTQNYHYDSKAGAGVYAYIIDTGIEKGHEEFEGRATDGKNFITNEPAADCNGHGTHVASTVGGVYYGVAKKVQLIGVKVLSCTGSGSNAGVIGGVDWVVSECSGSTKKGKCTANMSLGGGYSAALNAAVTAAVRAGVSFAVAAGNEESDACDVSPASTPTAVTVGSSAQAGFGSVEKQEDARSEFSNWGSCVDVFAPGSSITAAWIKGGYATISGTSMASPHVCGAMSLILSENPESTPAAIKAELLSTAVKNVIDFRSCPEAGGRTCPVSPKAGSCCATPNLLLHKSCGK